jgi:excisionase family DNA binding protein
MPAKTKKQRSVTGGTRGFVDPRPAEPIDVTGTYTYEQAAAHLQISRRALVRLVEAGRIGYVPINQRQRRILGRQLLDFLDRQARGPRR